ncbi:hypothetical protein IHE44_0003954 [Lamprotornis superbus]|uniref:Uncharacterized protein n=1 Tax=Lamprotornis superbus TaxID=245042 RepID=A0A835NWI9_9PASS|nr:hypothetical protein IHE44_0003954 [Lamprotornis superbus]
MISFKAIAGASPAAQGQGHLCHQAEILVELKQSSLDDSIVCSDGAGLTLLEAANLTLDFVLEMTSLAVSTPGKSAGPRADSPEKFLQHSLRFRSCHIWAPNSSGLPKGFCSC